MGNDFLILGGGIVLLTIHFALFGVFEKARRPAWHALVPVWNLVVLADVVGRPRRLLFGLLVPGWNVYVALRLGMDLARSFGKTARFGVALVLFGVVLAPIFAFGAATYVGPAAAKERGSAPH